MRVLSSTYGSRGDVPETRARATAVAGTIRTDGATVAATLLLKASSKLAGPVMCAQVLAPGFVGL
jgi:hypothetical protein